MIKTATLARKSHLPSYWLVAPLALAFVLAVAWIALTVFKPYTFHGMLLQSGAPPNDFTLTDPMGQKVSLHDFHGQFVLLYFGYTTCPDVCPTTLAELHRARQLLGKLGQQVQVIMITVDPDRDTPGKLADYMAHFDPSFIALTGSSDEIAQVAALYGVYYERAKEETSLGYLVNHTATVMAVDRNGGLRAVFPFGTSGEDFAADLQYLIQR